MKPLLPSPSKPGTTLPTPTNLYSLFTIIWTFFLIIPNVTSQYIIPPECASTCYLTAFDSEASECDALNASCLCTILTSTDYLTCIETDCGTADLQLSTEYGEQSCGAGYSTLVGGAAPATTATSNVAAPSTAVTSIAPALSTTPTEATAAEATSTSSAAAFAAATNTNDNFDIPTSTTALFPTLTPTPTPTTVIIQQDSSNSGGNGGLSPGAKAGIGAGVGVGGAAALCLVGVLAWKLGQQRKNKEEEGRIAAGTAMAAAAATAGGGGGNTGNNSGNNNNIGGAGAGAVSGGVNYVPSGSGEEAAWTKIEATATESELDTGHEEEGNGHVQDTML